MKGGRRGRVWKRMLVIVFKGIGNRDMFHIDAQETSNSTMPLHTFVLMEICVKEVGIFVSSAI